VADSQPFRSVTVYDTIDTFELGMNSGLDPLLIPKNQLSFASNSSVRDGFVTTRPAFSNQLAITYPTDEVKEAIEQGLFQGAGYYQPDSGNQSLLAQIAGRLFQFVVNGNGITVIERTIAGDPNPATTTQAWMWQSENFLIVNDGASLPIFFDGVTTRRSLGPSVQLGVATAQTVPPGVQIPAIGDFVTLTLADNWTDPSDWPAPYDVPVLFNNEYYQPIKNTLGYIAQLTSLYSVVGPIKVGDQILIRPSVAAVVKLTNTYSAYYNTVVDQIVYIITTALCTGIIGDLVLINSKVWRIVGILSNYIQVVAVKPNSFPLSVVTGDQILYAASSAPNVIAGVVAVDDTIPSIGTTAQLTLESAYTGDSGQIVYIGVNQFKIQAVPSVTPGTNTVSLINLTDTGTVYAAYGTGKKIISVPELTAGRMGAYGLGQNWMCLVDGLSFICSDTSRGASGTQANSFRDAVLKTTDLTFRGGNFSIPGAGNVITSMTFTANLDLALGQGSLQVGTAAFMASCQAPIDFSDPPATGPVLTFSLIGTGPLAQNSTIRVNSDVFFRSTPGLGSLVQARRDFGTPGNTPISDEVVRILNVDDKALLNYGSSVVFNNRWITTVSPQASSQGVLHAGLVVLNLDPISGVAGKQNPVYDGLWTGINALQLVQGTFNGVDRAFAFTFNVALSKIELYELLKTGAQEFDNGIIPIVWTFETGSLFNRDVKPRDVMVSLRDGEFAVTDVVGTVRFEVFYKSDQSCWTPWHSFSICSNTAGDPQYFPKLGLGEPSSADCDSILNTPLRDGYTFQIKFKITGYCRIVRARFMAVTLPTPKFQPPICDVVETVTVEV
jgi:hypothetical protein